MFPFKKKNPENSPEYPLADTLEEKSENVAKKGIRTMDTVVTGVILGGIIASLYGVKKLRDKKPNEIEDSSDNEHK